MSYCEMCFLNWPCCRGKVKYTHPAKRPTVSRILSLYKLTTIVKPEMGLCDYEMVRILVLQQMHLFPNISWLIQLVKSALTTRKGTKISFLGAKMIVALLDLINSITFLGIDVNLVRCLMRDT